MYHILLDPGQSKPSIRLTHRESNYPGRDHSPQSLTTRAHVPSLFFKPIPNLSVSLPGVHVGHINFSYLNPSCRLRQPVAALLEHFKLVGCFNCGSVEFMARRRSWRARSSMLCCTGVCTTECVSYVPLMCVIHKATLSTQLPARAFRFFRWQELILPMAGAASVL